MMRWTLSNTGCPNHVNWGINPNPAAVSRSFGFVMLRDRSIRGRRERRTERGAVSGTFVGRLGSCHTHKARKYIYLHKNGQTIGLERLPYTPFVLQRRSGDLT